MLASSESTLAAKLIVELHNRTNEAKEAFDQALIEIERQTEANERHRRQLDQERKQWLEEKITMNRLIASASPIVNLNVGGEKMSTSRRTLTIDESSLLAMMFSGKWEEKLMKDADGYVFLDYDPLLFKCLLNQLRTWSDPNIERIFHPPSNCEQEFIQLIRLLKFDERFILKREQIPIEYFQTTNANIQLTNNNRTCMKINSGWQYIFGTLSYSIGIHRIRFRLEKIDQNILFGICSRNKPPTGPLFYDKPTVCGWYTHGYVIENGQGSFTGWPQVKENDILDLTLNCDEQSLNILNEHNRVQCTMKIDTNKSPLPWCILILFYNVNSQVSLL